VPRVNLLGVGVHVSIWLKHHLVDLRFVRQGVDRNRLRDGCPRIMEALGKRR